MTTYPLRLRISHFSRNAFALIRQEHPFARTFASKRTSTAELDEDELRAARDWLSNLNSRTIPRHICQISFSRSGGPGGQNVNKFVVTPHLHVSHLETDSLSIYLCRVNSKATLKVPLDSLLPLVPPIIHSQLRSSRYAADRTQTLVIQSEESRKQATNVESCFEKLYQLLQSSAKDAIPGETSQEQKDRVQKLYGYITHHFVLQTTCPLT